MKVSERTGGSLRGAVTQAFGAPVSAVEIVKDGHPPPQKAGEAGR